MFTMFVIWALLATLMVALILIRQWTAREEDDNIHLEARANARQTSLAQRLEVFDRWNKRLITLVVAYGLVLLAAYLYFSFTQSQQISVQ